MVKGKLERKYKLIHNGRELSKGLLSEAGKYDAMQILVQRFDEGRPDAIDPDEVEIIDVLRRSNGSDYYSGVFLRSWILFLSYVQLF